MWWRVVLWASNSGATQRCDGGEEGVVEIGEQGHRLAVRGDKSRPQTYAIYLTTNPIEI